MILGMLAHLCPCDPMILRVLEYLGDGLPLGVVGMVAETVSQVCSGLRLVLFSENNVILENSHDDSFAFTHGCSHATRRE